MKNQILVVFSVFYLSMSALDVAAEEINPCNPPPLNPCAVLQDSGGADAAAAARARFEAAARARRESEERARRHLGYEDVGPGSDVVRDSDPRGMSDQIQRLLGTMSGVSSVKACPCPLDFMAAVNYDPGGGAGRSESQHEDELEERKKQLEKDLAKRRKDYLDSEAGKKTQKKLDEIEKERQKKTEEARQKHMQRVRDAQIRCCADGRAGKLAKEWADKRREIDEEAKKKSEDAIGEGMGESDPEGQEEYEDARNELEDVNNELRGIRQERAFEKERARRARMGRN